MISKVIEYRRMFHRYPELAMQEYWTTYKICSILEANSVSFIYGSELYAMLTGAHQNHSDSEKHYAKVSNMIEKPEPLEQMKHQNHDFDFNEKILDYAVNMLYKLVCNN